MPTLEGRSEGVKERGREGVRECLSEGVRKGSVCSIHHGWRSRTRVRVRRTQQEKSAIAPCRVYAHRPSFYSEFSTDKGKSDAL